MPSDVLGVTCWLNKTAPIQHRAPMSDIQKRIELTRMVLGKDWGSPKTYPATFHNRRLRDDVSAGPGAEKPESVNQGQSLLGHLLALFRGKGGATN